MRCRKRAKNTGWMRGEQSASCVNQNAVGLRGVGVEMLTSHNQASRKLVQNASDSLLTLQPIGGPQAFLVRCLAFLVARLAILFLPSINVLDGCACGTAHSLAFMGGAGVMIRHPAQHWQRAFIPNLAQRLCSFPADIWIVARADNLDQRVDRAWIATPQALGRSYSATRRVRFAARL